MVSLARIPLTALFFQLAHLLLLDSEVYIAGNSPLSSSSPLTCSITAKLRTSVTVKKTHTTQLHKVLPHGFTMEQVGPTEKPTPDPAQFVILSVFITVPVLGFVCILYVVDRGCQV